MGSSAHGAMSGEGGWLCAVRRGWSVLALTACSVLASGVFHGVYCNFAHDMRFRLFHRDSSMVVVVVAFRLCGPGALLGRVGGWDT